MISKYKCIISQPLTFVRVSQSLVTTSDACSRTVIRRNKEIEHVRELVSGGDSAAQLREEIKHLTKSERQELLHNAGFTLDIPPEQGLAMKADLGLSWNKLRIIRRQAHFFNALAKLFASPI